MKPVKFFAIALFFSLLQTIANAQNQNAGKVVTDYYAWVDAGNLDAVGTLLTEDFTASAAFAPAPFDKMGWRGVGQGFKTAFPDMKHEIVDWFANGNKVAVQGIFRGTNTGPNMGNPATGNKVNCPFNALFELDGKGRIKSLNTQFDLKSFEMQLMAGVPDPKKQAESRIRELFAAMDAGQVEKFGQYCAPDFRITNPFLSEPSPIGAFQGILQAQKGGFPDMKHEVVEIIAGGKSVTTRGIFRGTNTGSLMGNPPTGNTVGLPFLVLDELDDMGRIKNRFVQFDSKAFEAQLMAGLPAPGAAADADIRAMLAAADAGDVEKFMGYWAADGVNYFAGKQTSGEDMKKRVAGLKAAFPDIKRTLDEVIVSGNTVTVRGWVTGTNLGTFQGKAPTGNKVKVAWLGLYHLNDAGKVASGWVEFDTKTLDSQVNGAHNAKAIAENMMAELNKRNLEGVLLHCATNARFQGWGPQTLDAAGYRQAMTEILAAFPDARFTVLDVVADGNNVAVRHQLEGTHTGATFQGIARSNRKIVVPATATFHFQNGKATELWLNADMLGLLMQLGANPMAAGK